MPGRLAIQIALAAALTALALTAAPAQAGTWVVTNLQTCCTLNGSPFSGAFTASAINDGGDIVGSAVSGGGTRGYVLRNGQFKILNYLPAVPPHGSYGTGRPVPFSRATDINNAGVIVGTSSVGLVGRGPSEGHHAAVWRPFEAGSSLEAFDLGAFQYNTQGSGHTRPCNFVTQFPPDTGSGVLDCSGEGRGINNTDDVTGDSELLVSQTVEQGGQAAWPRFPFKIPGGNRKLIDVGETATSAPDAIHNPVSGELYGFRAAAINDAGQVIVIPNPATPGNAATSAVFSGLNSVAVPFAASGANSINDDGWVVGTGGAGTVPDPQRGKLWKGGPVETLAPLAGYRWSSAYAINDAGDVVGKSWYATDNSNYCEVATLWKHSDYSTPVDLSALEGVTGVKLYSAHAISNAGQILTEGIVNTICPSSTQRKPFLLTPPDALKIGDATADEPESGTVDMTFHVTLDVASSEAITVDYATADGTGPHPAVAGEDYTSKTGTLTFAAGDKDESLTVPIKANGFQVDRTFVVNLSNPTGTEIDDGQAIGTIRGRGPLEVTITPDKATVDVPQEAKGPVPQDVLVEVAVRNRGKLPIATVTVPDKLTIGWDGAAPTLGFPITQTPPSEQDRTAGPLDPGKTLKFTYKLTIGGDGRYVLDALVLGNAAGQTVTGFGTGKLTADTQVLVYTGELGAKVKSPKNPALIKAGTQFLVNIGLENRSIYRTVLVDPIYPELVGNASDGHVQERDVLPTASAANPTGSPDEVQPSKMRVLVPKEKREFVSVIRTGASDAFVDAAEGQGGVGGTRAMAKFKAPRIRDITDTNDIKELDPSRVSMTPGSADFLVGIDDSHPDPPPFGYPEATLYVGKGAIVGLWHMTWGTVRGLLWDLPTGVFFGAIDVSMGTLNAIDRQTELWTALESDPVARAQYINAVADKTATVFEEAPASIALAPNALFNTVSNAVGNYMTTSSKQWEAGDWRPVVTSNVSGGAEVVATALSLGSGLLARSPAAAARWQAAKTALFTKATGKLAKVTRKVTKVRAAVNALAGTVVPGLEYSAAKHMPKLFGVSAKEAAKIANFARNFKPPLSVVLRSRAQQSIEFLEKELAVVKPYWIKTKNVSHADVEYLGYHADDIGKVVIRKPISKTTLQANLAKKRIKKGSPQYKDAIDRWDTRVKEYKSEFREMQKWHKEGKVKGKWPWQDNGVDPRVRADETSTFRFKLFPDGKGQLQPKVYVPGKGWKFITGDIDLIAITRANGSALTDLEHVKALDELKYLIGAQHPESATWVNKGKFWFRAKKGYLTNDGKCCLAQFGPDGKIRAVKFNEKLSDPENWDPKKYRIYWEGGYQTGPGQ